MPLYFTDVRETNPAYKQTIKQQVWERRRAEGIYRAFSLPQTAKGVLSTYLRWTLYTLYISIAISWRLYWIPLCLSSHKSLSRYTRLLCQWMDSCRVMLLVNWETFQLICVFLLHCLQSTGICTLSFKSAFLFQRKEVIGIIYPYMTRFSMRLCSYPWLQSDIFLQPLVHGMVRKT